MNRYETRPEYVRIFTRTGVNKLFAMPRARLRAFDRYRTPSNMAMRYATDRDVCTYVHVRRDRRRNALSNRSSLFIGEEGKHRQRRRRASLGCFCQRRPSRRVGADRRYKSIVPRFFIADAHLPRGFRLRVRRVLARDNGFRLKKHRMSRCTSPIQYRVKAQRS